MTYHSYTEGNGPFLIHSRDDRRSAAHRARAKKDARDPQLAAQSWQPVHRHESSTFSPSNVVFYSDSSGVRRGRGGKEQLQMPLGCDGSVYSDRVSQHYSAEQIAATRTHLADGLLGYQTLDALSAYLSSLLGRAVNVHTLWQYNHAASGHPVYQMFFDHVEPDAPSSETEQ